MRSNTAEADLNAAFTALGLRLPESGSGERAAQVELGDFVYWLNRDGRGNLWINACEKKENEPATTANQAPVAPTEPFDPASSFAKAMEDRQGRPLTAEAVSPGALAGVRLLLKEMKTGAVAGKVDRLAEELGKSPGEFLATLTGAGLQVPEKAREKPVFVEQAGEIFLAQQKRQGRTLAQRESVEVCRQERRRRERGRKKSKRARPKRKRNGLSSG